MARRPPGRPSSYRPEFAAQAIKLARLGATDEELADFFGVEQRTIQRWKVAEPAFRQALKEGKLLADARVADSLYQRAVGYSYDHEEIKVINGKVVRVRTTKQHAPDVTACIFWLKNRQRAKWRDRPEPEPMAAADIREMYRKEAEAFGRLSKPPAPNGVADEETA